MNEIYGLAIKLFPDDPKAAKNMTLEWWGSAAHVHGRSADEVLPAGLVPKVKAGALEMANAAAGLSKTEPDAAGESKIKAAQKAIKATGGFDAEKWDAKAAEKAEAAHEANRGGK